MIDNKQVKVSLTIIRYKDVVIYDVVPMKTSHVLLERLWKFDKKTSHDGYSNKYPSDHHFKKVVLAPLIPSMVI